MATDVKVPAAGESISEVIIGTWLKAVGDPVAADEPIVRFVQVVQRRDVPAWHDQHVHRRLGVDVVERDQGLVLVDDGCLDLSVHDPAEEAGCHFRLAAGRAAARGRAWRQPPRRP